MRIQEHIFQGFFGITKKKDAAKYYSDRIGELKGLDSDLDKAIENFQKIITNHNLKLKAYYEFLKNFDKESLDSLKEQISVLEDMFDTDEDSNESEEKDIMKVQDTLCGLMKNEENTDITQLEQETMTDLKELSRLLDTICPLWKAQLEFMQKNDEEILGDKSNIKILSDILKEEGDILKMEENLLRKIDLKTGAILRKTTLKMRDVEKTKDMNMTYREIRHIR